MTYQSHSMAQIRLAIKNLLKKHKYTYEDLGAVLKLSEPAVKRLMTKGSFTLDRIELIAKWFGLSFFEFIDIAAQLQSKAFQLNSDQEALLVKNPQALYLLLLLGNGFSFEEVKKRSRMSESHLKKFLHILDKTNLIELQASGRVGLKSRGPYLWVKGGELQKAIHKDFIDLLSKSLTAQPSSDTLQSSFELYLSKRLLEQMKKDFEAIIDRYMHLSRIEKDLVIEKDVFPVIGLAFLKPYDGWGQILNKNNIPKSKLSTIL